MASRSGAQGGARAKLRAHFLANLNRVMESTELREVASGISEWLGEYVSCVPKRDF